MLWLTERLTAKHRREAFGNFAAHLEHCSRRRPPRFEGVWTSLTREESILK